MSNNTFETTTIVIREENPRVEAKVEWEYDECPDTSCIGEYSDQAQEGCVDRKTGRLLGGSVSYPEEPEESLGDAAYDEWAAICDEIDENRGLEVLADDLGCTWEHSSYRYFIPYAGGEEVGSPEFVRYATQDYDMIEALNQGQWFYAGCVVTILVDGVEVSESSVWGIEWGTAGLSWTRGKNGEQKYTHKDEEKYHDDVVKECLADALAQISDLAPKYQKIAVWMAAYEDQR